MRALLLALSLVSLFSCRSRSSQSQLAAMVPIEESYATRARIHILDSRTKMLGALERFLSPDQESSDLIELHAAGKHWAEALSFFIHVFPITEERDLYEPLLLEIDLGLFLIDQGQNVQQTRVWAESYRTLLASEATLELLASLHTDYGSRRRISMLPRSYWFGVNFIPDLRASFQSNLRDYFRAQRKALAGDRERAKARDIFFPEQIVYIEYVRSRLETVLSLEKTFLPIGSTQVNHDETAASLAFYRDLTLDLERYHKLRDSKEEGKASVLGAKIRREWQNEINRSPSSPKS